MHKNIKKIFAVSTLSFLFLQMAYVSLIEPEIAVAAPAPDSLVVTLNVDAGISISNGADVTMAPNLATGTPSSIGSSSWTVITNNNTGYKIDVKASTDPALKSGSNTIEDYTETVANTPETWSVPAGYKEFGYSVYGTGVAAEWSSGSVVNCGTSGTPNANAKYLGFSTTDRTVISTSAPTLYAGTVTNICFAAEQDTIYAPAGAYTATITATATTN